MAEIEEKLKSLLMKVKEESEKDGWKLNIQKTKIMVSSPITSWQIYRETIETVRDFILRGSKITADGDCSHESKRRLLFGRKAMTNFRLVQFSRSIMSDSLWPYGLQHARPPCPSPTPGVYSKSCPLSQWCHPTISFSTVPFSSRFQSFSASRSFQMNQFFASRGQSWLTFTFHFFRLETKHNLLIAFFIAVNIKEAFPSYLGFRSKWKMTSYKWHTKLQE